MKTNQIYFQRNRGSWDWQVQFELIGWSLLWGAKIPVFSKICHSFLILVQRIFGPLTMWTHVEFPDASRVVHHTTKIKKWGVSIYRSEKEIFLDEDGSHLRLEGKEYYWPLGFLGFRFAPTAGQVDPSTTRAAYRMPMAGTVCDCRAFLESPQGYIEIATPWLKGRYTLTEASNRILQSRF